MNPTHLRNLAVSTTPRLPAPGRRSAAPALKPRFAGSLVALTLLLATPVLRASSRADITPVPQELQSTHFTVTVDGQPAPVINAAANYYALSFDLRKPVKISITAPTPDFWARGVEVQPWRENIRPDRRGSTISFTLRHPAKLSITRPGDHLANAEMLFLFANPPEQGAPRPDTPGLRYYGPGVHREYIDAHDGDRIYLAPGAVVLGGLNLWDVHDVKVFGRGTILYDGPQNPADDDGWRNQKNWHAIVMHNARNIDIRGITCIVRSRTWMIQMRDSRFINFDNIKVIGGSSGNANQDGMDWLGGGDTLVRNSFFRAADDVFAMQGNWDGYAPELMTVPGHDVTNITVEGSVLSTSISNIVRVGWPTKTFNSSNFTMRDTDVIHMGSGGCGIPFALFEIWGMPNAHGLHQHYLFDDIRLEDWYSLVQLQQLDPGIRDITLRNIWAPESPAMVPSTLVGDVKDVHLENIRIGDQIANTADAIPLSTSQGAAAPSISPGQPLHAAFAFPAGPIAKGRKLTFDASASGPTPIQAYVWFFGDGTEAHGRKVRHKFRDTDGTLLNGSDAGAGRFRVMLRVTARDGHTDWTTHPILVPATLNPAHPVTSAEPGLHYTIDANDAQQQTLAQGVTSSLALPASTPASNYRVTFEGLLRIPTDGGYSFSLFSRDTGHLLIDGIDLLKSPAPWPQVCGSVGNAVQSATGAIGLSAGLHTIRVDATKTTGEDAFRVLWEGPAIPLSPIPASALFHDSQ